MIVLVVCDLSDRVRAGAVLRDRSIAAALRATCRGFTVFDVDAVRRRAGCAQQCGNCAAVIIDGYGSPVPDPFASYYCERAEQTLRSVCTGRGVTGVWVSNIRLHQYFRAAVEVGMLNVAFDMHNAEADLLEEIGAHPLAGELAADDVDIPATRLVEECVSRNAKLVTFVSKLDSAKFEKNYGRVRKAVVPNAVDVAATVLLPSGPQAPDMVFLGYLNYFPNIVAALTLIDDILPRVRHAMPGATVTVAGRKPHASILSRSGKPGLRVLANPPDTAPILSRRITVVPLALGGGSRLKILEAFAAGSPVISTVKGVEGLDVVPGTHYLQATDPDSYVDRIRELCRDPGEDRRRRTAALSLVREKYSWLALTEPVRAAIDLLTS